MEIKMPCEKCAHCSSCEAKYQMFWQISDIQINCSNFEKDQQSELGNGYPLFSLTIKRPLASQPKMETELKPQYEDDLNAVRSSISLLLQICERLLRYL